MSETKSYINITNSTDRNFGLVFGSIFLLVSFYPLLQSLNIRLWALLVAIVFFVLAFFKPKYLSLLNKLWFRLGMLLGAIIAPLVMASIFFLTVTPIGLAIRFIGKDLLTKKLDKNSKTYWIERWNKNTIIPYFSSYD